MAFIIIDSHRLNVSTFKTVTNKLLGGLVVHPMSQQRTFVWKYAFVSKIVYDIGTERQEWRTR